MIKVFYRATDDDDHKVYNWCCAQFGTQTHREWEQRRWYLEGGDSSSHWLEKAWFKREQDAVLFALHWAA